MVALSDEEEVEEIFKDPSQQPRDTRLPPVDL